MTLEELETLLAEIADGAPERTELDWKRAWWDFTNEKGQHEFLKDISAMANADGEEARHILVGVASDGAVHSAAMPDDEARLQERLHAITPMPNVSFTPLKREDGRVVTVITVAPPPEDRYDRPYVAKLGKQHVVLVRVGSSRITASRARFDRWCGARTRAREQEVERAEEQKVVQHVVDLHRLLCRLRQVALDVIDAPGPPGLAIYGWVDRLPEYDRVLEAIERVVVASPESVHTRWGWLSGALREIPRGISRGELARQRAAQLTVVIDRIEEAVPRLRR